MTWCFTRMNHVHSSIDGILHGVFYVMGLTIWCIMESTKPRSPLLVPVKIYDQMENEINYLGDNNPGTDLTILITKL